MGYAADAAEAYAKRGLQQETVDRRRADAEVVRKLETTLDGAVIPSQESASTLRVTAAPVPHD